jgi:Acetyltransferase (GNAT) domain
MQISSYSKSEILRVLENSAPSPETRAMANPFATPEWLLCYVNNVVEPEIVIHVIASQVTGSVDLPDLMSSLVLYSSAKTPHQIKSFNNYYSSQFHIPSIGSAAEFHREFRKVPGNHLIISPFCVSEESKQMLNLLNHQGWRSKIFSQSGNWYLPSAGLTFESYLEILKQTGSNPVRRKTKAFLKDSTNNRLQVISNLADVPNAPELFASIYAKSWRSSESHPEFVSAWMKSCSDRGWLRLGIAWHKGIAVAMQFWFTIDKKAFIYKMAYDDSYGDLSAGTVLSGELFRYALDVDKVDEVDYLSGDDPYKKTWVTHRRDLIGIEAFNIRTLNGLRLKIGDYAKNSPVARDVRAFVARMKDRKPGTA